MNIRQDNISQLSSGEIQVWQVSTNNSPEVFDKYKRALSNQELIKASLFEFKHVRDAYIVSHGALRILLAAYLNIPANLLKMGHSKKGKPHSLDDPNLYFNMSNSGKFVVIAFSKDREVGIDIEQIRPLTDLDDLIKRNFADSEVKFIASKPKEKERRFFRFWTIKESYLKATGEGMRLTPDKLEFSVSDDGIKQLSVKGFFELEDWNFREFSISTDYVGTITYDGRDDSVNRQITLLDCQSLIQLH